MQLELFQLFKPQFKITNRIRLIELFGGIGAQAKALENIGADFEHYRYIEIDKYACDSYNAVHGTNFTPTDIQTVHGADLGIVDTDSFTYLLTHFPARIYPLPVCKWVCQKGAELEAVCFGKSKDYFVNAKHCHKSW